MSQIFVLHTQVGQFSCKQTDEKVFRLVTLENEVYVGHSINQKIFTIVLTIKKTSNLQMFALESLQLDFGIFFGQSGSDKSSLVFAKLSFFP
jgi:hypothetical protein